MNSPSPRDDARSPSPSLSSSPLPETSSTTQPFDPFATPDDELLERDAELDSLEEELDPFDEEIAAYLGGELDDDARAAFERRLDDEPELRARVDVERSVWNALSLLDVAKPNERLTESTVERLEAETQTELRTLSATLRRRRFVRFGGIASTSILLAALGFGVCSTLFPDVRTRRERDCRVVERLAQLEIVGDFDYLTALDASQLFAAPFPRPAQPDGPPTPNEPPEPFDASPTRQKSFEELSQDRVFYRLQQKFERLDDETQKQRRALYRRIVDAPNADELWRLLDRYCAWFAAWPNDDDREKLLAAPIPERLEIVRRQLAFARMFAERRRGGGPRFAQNSTRSGFPGSPGSPRPNESERRDASPQIRAFRNALPEELRDVNLDAVGEKYDEFLRARRGYGGERSAALAFLTEESAEKIVAALDEKARVYLRKLGEEERSAALGLLVTLAFWEREERSFKPTRPLQNDDRANRSFDARPFEERDAVRELAETLRNLPPEFRDYVTARPADEIRGFLWATHWRFANVGFPNGKRDGAPAPPDGSAPPFQPPKPPEK